MPFVSKKKLNVIASHIDELTKICKVFNIPFDFTEESQPISKQIEKIIKDIFFSFGYPDPNYKGTNLEWFQNQLRSAIERHERSKKIMREALNDESMDQVRLLDDEEINNMFKDLITADNEEEDNHLYCKKMYLCLIKTMAYKVQDAKQN